MTAWTSIATSGTSYTVITNPSNRLFDDPGLSYDDASNYYDGSNPNMWSSIVSSVTSWTSIQS